MKIIDLLNKIANGEVPKKIKVNDKYTYIHDGIDYKNDRGTYLFDTYLETTTKDMNIKVEILDDEEKGLPEKLETYKENNEMFLENFCYKNLPIHKDSLSLNERVLVDKLNEIIEYLEKQRKGE